MVHFEPAEARAGVDFKDLRPGAAGPLPQHAPAHAGIHLARGNIVLIHIDDLAHVAILPASVRPIIWKGEIHCARW